MYRLSGNDPATAPSVNADKLNGIDSAGFLGATATAADSGKLDGSGPRSYTTQVDGIACVDVGGCGTGSGGVITAVMELPVSVPADGVVAVSYTYAGGATPVGSNVVQTWLTWDDSSCGSWFFFPLDAIPGSYSNLTMDTVLTLANLSGQSVIEVSAGVHTLTLCAVSLSDDLDSFDGQLTSLWSASGSGSTLSSLDNADVQSSDALESAVGS